MSRSALRAAAAALVVLAGAAAADPLPERGVQRPGPVPRADRPAAAPAGARLVYFGGRVLSSVEIVMVLWGEGRYAPYVTGAAQPSLPDLLRAVAGSAYLAGLAEYDTTRAAASGAPGTGQHIGPGRFAGVSVLSPAPGGDPIDDDAIAAELAARLDRGALPAPRRDAVGNADMLYVVHFPAGRRIAVGGEESCRDFCAYHGTFRWRGLPVSYAVVPDLSPGSGCELGCGAGTPFERAATVVTHELVEAVTDPDVASGSGLGPPLAWLDPVHGEAGDLCAHEAGTVIGTDGVAWPVQKVWSNVHDGCIVPGSAGAAPLVASAPPRAAPTDADAAPRAPAAAVGAAAPRPVAALAVRPAVATGPAAPPLGALPRALPPEPSPPPLSRGVRVEIVEENDAFAAQRHPTDELYTQGLRIAARWAVDGVDGDDGVTRELGFAVGQNIYTPHDLRTRDLAVLRQDRPYAGWLYAAFLMRDTDPAPHTLRLGADASGPGELRTDVELAVGVTGPPAGGAEVQSRAHAVLRTLQGGSSSPAPQGWGVYQTRTAPTFDATVRQQVDLVQASARLGDFTARTGSVLGVRLAPRARLDVGTTFDAIGAGVETRFGLLSPRPAPRARAPFELYGFARVEGRRVWRNALVDGPLRGGVTTLVGVRRQVADLDVGVVLRLGSAELGYATLWRTSELSPNPPLERRIHAVGQLTLAWVGN